MTSGTPAGAVGDVLTRIADRLGSLSASEAKVARYVAENPEQALLMSAVQVGDTLGASDMTVVRAARSLGYDGWPDLRRALGAQRALTVHPARRLSTRLTSTRRESPATLLDIVFEEACERITMSRTYIDADAFAHAVRWVSSAGVVHTYGVGASSVSAEYLALKLQREGIRARHAKGMGFAFADAMLALREGDVLVLFAPGREFTEVAVVIEEARRLGLATILFTDKYRDAYVDRVDCVLRTASSAAGLTGENLPTLVAVDALVLAVGHVDPDKALATSRRLNSLRRALQRRPGRAGSRREAERPAKDDDAP